MNASYWAAVRYEKAYYDALIKCGERYYEMSASMPELQAFVTEFTEGAKSRMPLMKLNRWLGYIQGTLIAGSLTSVEAERDWTRPLFRPLDFPA